MDTMKDTKMQPATDVAIEELRKVIADCYWPTSPVAINEILDRLEAAEKDIALKEKVIDALGSELNAIANERDALRAKIEAMERQEPIKYERRIKRRNEHTWGHWRECYKTDYTKAKTTGGHYPRYSDDLFDYEMRPIYALPGAKGE